MGNDVYPSTSTYLFFSQLIDVCKVGRVILAVASMPTFPDYRRVSRMQTKAKLQNTQYRATFKEVSFEWLGGSSVNIIKKKYHSSGSVASQ